MPMTAKVLVTRVVNLCVASRRMLAMRRCTRASRALALRALAEPRRLRENALLARRSCFSATACDFGPTMISPVESVASCGHAEINADFSFRLGYGPYIVSLDLQGNEPSSRFA